MQPMAAAFDLVLSEYAGYTDETILDLTLDRFRQMVNVIMARKRKEFRREQLLAFQVAEVHAKAIVHGLAGLAQSKKQAGNIAQFADKQIDFVVSVTQRKKKKELPSTDRVLAAFGERSDGLVGVRG